MSINSRNSNGELIQLIARPKPVFFDKKIFINNQGDFFLAKGQEAELYSSSTKFINLDSELRDRLSDLIKVDLDSARKLIGNPDFKNELIKLTTPVIKYGEWEKNNPGAGSSLGGGISGYKSLGNGYFNSDQGKYGNINLPYITLEKLTEISKGKTISVKISEPHRCGYCRTYDSNTIYLTGFQARKIGWTGRGFPSFAKVKDGRIQ